MPGIFSIITLTIMQNRNILVTGACGQLGRELRRLADVYGISGRFVFTDIVQGEDGIFELDMTDKEAVLAAVKDGNIGIVVNCAAYTNVDKAEEDEAAAASVNCDAVRNLAEACRENSSLLIHVSTDYVFDGKACVPYTEDAETAPANAYGRTKLAGEKAVEESGCKAIIIRTAWLYSPYGKNFVKTMLKLTGERNSLKVVYDQVGTPTCAADLASAILAIIADGNAENKTGIYHYTDEGVCSWYDFAVAVNELAGHDCAVGPCRSEEYPSKALRPHYSVLDKRKIKSAFGLSIPHWRESLKNCIGILSDNNI